MLYLIVVGEWVWGVVSALAGLVGVLSLSVWILITQVLNSIPTPDDIKVIGKEIVQEELDSFGISPNGGGQRTKPPEGMVEKILAQPAAQNFLANLFNKFSESQTGGMTNYGP